MKIIALSDTHGLHNRVQVPVGDVLIHAGDWMNSGTRQEELTSFSDWFRSQPHQKKIVIAGNHDLMVEKNRLLVERTFGPDVTYLQDSGCEYLGIKFWGSPYTPEFYNWAFNVPRHKLQQHWDLIPEDTNVLITHGPPWGYLDGPYHKHTPQETELADHLGCVYLAYKVERMHLDAHIFGHLHNFHGKDFDPVNRTSYYNVAICNEQYKAVNPCTIIHLGEE